MRSKRHTVDVAIAFIAIADMLFNMLILALIQPVKKEDAGAPARAEYIITADWDKMEDADVDLYGLGPPDYKTPVYYSNPEGAKSAMHLDHDSRGFSTDRLENNGKLTYIPHREIITLRGILPGDYTFGLHLYGYSRDGVRILEHGLNLKVHVEVIKVEPTVTTVFQKDEALDHIGDSLNFFAMEVRPDGSYVLNDLPINPISALAIAPNVSSGSYGYTPGSVAPTHRSVP